MIGQTLDHYRIEAKLGEGGMGVVYRAVDTRLGRPVARKVLPSERLSDPERKRRFAQEAKAASALNHPNIITINDLSSRPGRDFIAMEYVAGKTLDQVIGRKGLPLRDTLKYAGGAPSKDSDVDLLVVMETDAQPLHAVARISAAIDHPFPLDILVVRPSRMERIP